MPGAGYYAKLSAGWKQIFLLQAAKNIPVCEEIAFLLKDCDDKQISAAGDIIRIYADSVENKGIGCMYGRGKCRQLKKCIRRSI